MKISSLFKSPLALMLTIMAVMLLFGFTPAEASDASSSSSSSLPWDTPLQTLREDISGPFAFAIALLGIVAGGAALIWGGEISEFTRRIVYLVLVICIVVFSNTLLTGTLFSGAMVPDGGITVPSTSPHTAPALNAHSAQRQSR